MIKLLIAYDKQDLDFGAYFESCYDDVSRHAFDNGVNDIYSFDGTENHQTIITDLIQQLEEKPFIFWHSLMAEKMPLFSSAPIVDINNAYFLPNR
ncbi:MAG: hypothetical protein IPH31_22815 [Lewinellaceae bacterium]|nr:hypothetical protein [Lewinellaceae bacterium]